MAKATLFSTHREGVTMHPLYDRYRATCRGEEDV